MGALQGRHALITGGSSGVGRSVALALARAGAAVTITGRRERELAEVADREPGVTAVCGDVTEEGSVAAMFASARERRGPVDIVVANAGSTTSAPFDATPLAQWDATLAVNLTGVFLTARAGLTEMLERGWGRIICIASTAGLKGYAYVAPYCAAKHGVVGLTRALALETARRGVTVNAICPGYTDTPMLDAAVQNIMDKTGRSEAEARASLRRVNPQGRFIAPEEIAAAVLWLCGAEADSVTGQAVAIAGGEI